jgi:hypothetical protein
LLAATIRAKLTINPIAHIAVTMFVPRCWAVFWPARVRV